MSYLTRQSVREEAGFQEVETEVLSGVVDGANASFAGSRVPIVDNNDDDLLGITDVIVRVNGVPVAVSSIDGTTGLFVLASAPAADSEVTATYASSALPDSYVTKLIVEAEAIVDAALRKFTTVPLSEADVNYPTARRISTLYAGGFALIRDYGKNTDTEETSKDGYEKLRTARKLLDELITSIKDNGESSSSGGDAKTVSEGHPLSRRHHTNPASHDYFLHHNRPC